MIKDFDMQQIFIDFDKIETSQDLKKHKLNLSDYKILSEVLDEFYNKSQAFTFVEAVKNWCIKRGIRAERKYHGWILY